MNFRQLINIIDEADKTSYEAWDHSYPAEYSKHLEKTFGAPDEATDEQVVWHNKDGFKRIVSRDEYILHGSPAPHYDFIYCYIDLEVPEDMSDELAKCSGSILIDHLKNEVGARCGSLTANAVTLNFVLDAVAGRVEPVKEEYEKRILDMRAMFEKGERYENDWWEDQSSDADPDNPFYKEHQDEIDEGTRCWKGYERKGMKTMFGKRVPNCVKKEDLDGIDYCVNCGEILFAEGLDENLKKWFKEKWVRFGPDGKIRGDCARGSSEEGKPKCLPAKKAYALGKKGRAKAASRKRRQDPQKNRRGPAKNVKTK